MFFSSIWVTYELSGKLIQMFIRTVVSRSGNTAVQVVQKHNRRNRLVKHIGTARFPLELSQLKEQAQTYINEQRIKSGVISFFDSRFNQSKLDVLLAHLRFTHAFDTVTYRFLLFFYRKIGFGQLENACFKDLVIARIIQPASKRKTRDILEERFGKKHSLTFIYRTLKTTSQSDYHAIIERIAHTFVLNTLHEPLTALFFDVTTLYFEAFDEDDIRRYGFSKDGKHNQPQIVVALIVTASGMPLLIRMFEGDTFEGHTMLPCIKQTRQKFHRDHLIVVADAAMLSQDNLSLLEKNELGYIVGARLGSMAKPIL